MHIFRSFRITNTFLISILMLTLITAGAHLYLASQPDEKLRFWFLLNGLGYLALLFAYILPQLRRFHHVIRWLLLGYVVLTIALWFFLGSPHEGSLDPFDVVVKAVEVTLAINILFDIRQGKNRKKRIAPHRV